MGVNVPDITNVIFVTRQGSASLAVLYRSDGWWAYAALGEREQSCEGALLASDAADETLNGLPFSDAVVSRFFHLCGVLDGIVNGSTAEFDDAVLAEAAGYATELSVKLPDQSIDPHPFLRLSAGVCCDFFSASPEALRMDIDSEQCENR